MSLEENKTLVRRMVEASNKKDLAVIDGMLDECMAVNFDDHQPISRIRLSFISQSLPNEHLNVAAFLRLLFNITRVI